MKKILFVIGIVSTMCASAIEEGFVNMFDLNSIKGWKVNGGSAEFTMKDGVVTGKGVPGSYGNTFLCTEKDYENFILKIEFRIESGNSGVQFRSSTNPCSQSKHGNRIFGYQSEITDNGHWTARIYDEDRRGYQHGIIWLDRFTSEDCLSVAEKSFKKGDWNEMVIQCVGPSMKTWLNGNPVADIFDDCQQKGFIGLQIHAQGKDSAPYIAQWRNARIKELPPCEGWKDVSKDAKCDSCKASKIARVTYKFTGNNVTNHINEVAKNRCALKEDKELLHKLYNAKENTLTTICAGERTVKRFNWFEMSDKTCCKKSCKKCCSLKDIEVIKREVMMLPEWMLEYINK